jgi:DNA-binding transcriptional regulator GbsR (MarR family)
MANAAKLPADRLAETLGPAGRRFVLHWGEMGWRWGVNRTVAQVARSNVSNSLRELENWKLVRVVHLTGDRRDHYETAQDPWELLRIIVRERKAREFDPTIDVLRECVADPSLAQVGPAAQRRVRETLTLMEALSRWTDEMLNLETPTLTRLVRLGAKVQSFLRGKKA